MVTLGVDQGLMKMLLLDPSLFADKSDERPRMVRGINISLAFNNIDC